MKSVGWGRVAVEEEESGADGEDGFDGVVGVATVVLEEMQGEEDAE